MKIKDATHYKVPKPFVNLEKPLLSIIVSVDVLNRITQFEVAHGSKKELFRVIDFEVETAWKQLEKFIKTCEEFRK